MISMYTRGIIVIIIIVNVFPVLVWVYVCWTNIMEERDNKDDHIPSPKRPRLVDEDEEEVKEKDTVVMELKDTKNLESENTFLMEKDVGITEYVNEEHSRFFAILKQRYN